MIYEYQCNNCGIIHEESHGMINRPNVFCPSCECSCVKLISRGVEFAGVNGHNNMYNFVDHNTTGKPVVINGRRQWRSHLKSLGMTDDINQGVPKSDIKPHKESWVEKGQKREVYKKEIAGVLKEKGILQKYGK